MSYTLAQRASIKLVQSRNRMRKATDALKRDLRYDLNLSRDKIHNIKKEVQDIGKSRVSQKPFISVAAAFAAGALTARLLKHRRCQ